MEGKGYPNPVSLTPEPKHLTMLQSCQESRSRATTPGCPGVYHQSMRGNYGTSGSAGVIKRSPCNQPSPTTLPAHRAQPSFPPHRLEDKPCLSQPVNSVGGQSPREGGLPPAQVRLPSGDRTRPQPPTASQGPGRESSAGAGNEGQVEARLPHGQALSNWVGEGAERPLRPWCLR